MIRLLIVEDQAIVLSALSALLNLEEDMSVVATAINGKEALVRCAELEIDIVISDIEMPEMDGLTLAHELNSRHPHIKTIILTTFSKSGYVKRSQEAKVSAYLLKDSPSDLLAKTIREVNGGKIVIAPELVSELWRLSVDPLTEKEKTLLIMAHQGVKSVDIAKKMNLSAGTVRNYAHSICQKLGAKNRVEAAAIAHRNGWL
jgi:two-component system response regulator DesR